MTFLKRTLLVAALLLTAQSAHADSVQYIGSIVGTTTKLIIYQSGVIQYDTTLPNLYIRTNATTTIAGQPDILLQVNLSGQGSTTYPYLDYPYDTFQNALTANLIPYGDYYLCIAAAGSSPAPCSSLVGFYATSTGFSTFGAPIGDIEVTPTYNTTQSDSTMTITAETDGSYYNGVRVQITNMDNLRTFEWFEEVTGVYSTTTIPNLGDGLYQGTVCLTSDPLLNAMTQCVDVLYTVNYSTVIPDDPYDNSTSSLGRVPSVFNLISSLANRYPFNWLFETAEVLNSLQDQTSTTSIPTVSVDYSGLHMLQNIPTTTAQNLTFTFFSSATFDTVANIPAIGAMRTLLSYILWIGFAMFSFRRISGILKHS